MTTAIGLVRENAETMQPPRMLWVPFPLGYPLGRPADAAFQHRVIGHALGLLDCTEGPVLEDFPEEAGIDAPEAAPACPISFARPTVEDGSWRAQLDKELADLRPWYELGVRRRGRTTVGVCESSIDDIARDIARWLDERDAPLPDLEWFKYAIEDAKAWYGEALIAQPGDYPPGYAQQLFWSETRFGAALREYYTYFSERAEFKLFARLVASREAIGESTGGAEDLQRALSDEDPREEP